jgi:hypothetical protein
VNVEETTITLANIEPDIRLNMFERNRDKDEGRICPLMTWKVSWKFSGGVARG